MSDYEISQWDAPDRYLVVKDGGDGYIVELNYFGKGQPLCSCRWYETAKNQRDIKPCRHVLMVREKLSGPAPAYSKTPESSSCKT